MANLLPEISQICTYNSLEINGLMTMPPLSVESTLCSLTSEATELRDYLAIQFPSLNWSELSMGTSSDFEMAIQEGATFIRVGTAIMGPRPAKI